MLSKLEELGVWAARSLPESAAPAGVQQGPRVLLKTDELFALWRTIGEVNANPDGRAQRSIQN